MTGKSDSGIGCSRQPVREQTCHHLGNVRNQSHRVVVLGGRHRDRNSTKLNHDIFNGATTEGFSPANHPRATDEKICAGRNGPTALASGQRMRTDIAIEVGTQRDEFVNHADLHAGNIRDRRLRPGSKFARDNVGRDIRRNRHNHERRLVIGLWGAAGAIVDCEGRIGARRIMQNHVNALGPQTVTDAGTEQSSTHDAHLPSDAA